MHELPKELTLDYKKWVCGLPESINSFIKKNCLGKGKSALQNTEGYRCCLGQFCLQAGVKQTSFYKNDMFYEQPADLNIYIKGLTKRNGTNTVLSKDAIQINDNAYISISEKIRQLRRLFNKRGYKIKLKNFPKKILRELGEI